MNSSLKTTGVQSKPDNVDDVSCITPFLGDNQQSTPQGGQSAAFSSRPFFLCDVPDCTSTFTRPHDLARHKKTIHGPKQHCPYPMCKFATGRNDKMNEHNRKKHPSKGK
jgi:hypothetical protein